jgi:hypothetical protein
VKLSELPVNPEDHKLIRNGFIKADITLKQRLNYQSHLARMIQGCGSLKLAGKLLGYPCEVLKERLDDPEKVTREHLYALERVSQYHPGLFCDGQANPRLSVLK